MVISSQHEYKPVLPLHHFSVGPHMMIKVDRGSKLDLVSLVDPNKFRLMLSYFGFGVLVQVSCADRLIVTRLPVIFTPPLTITHNLVLIPTWCSYP